MAIVEAEILSAEKDLTSVVVGVLYRADGIEHSKHSLRFTGLSGVNFTDVTQRIIQEGLQIKNSLEAQVEVKKLVGTKILIENESAVVK